VAKAPLGASATANGGAGRTIEQVYQKKSQLEHILLRPDTYVGSVEKQTAQLWVHTAASEAAPGAPPKLELRSIGYVPGLYKIFDEILVNAADNKVRDPSMTTLRVDLDSKAGTIRVYNDGDGIPVEMHKDEGVYVPELIFGHLLTSSNYDDTEKKARAPRSNSSDAHPPSRADRGRPKRLRRQAGQHLQQGVCAGDVRRQARAALPTGIPLQHVRQGGARHHRLQAHRQLDVRDVQAGPG